MVVRVRKYADGGKLIKDFGSSAVRNVKRAHEKAVLKTTDAMEGTAKFTKRMKDDYMREKGNRAAARRQKAATKAARNAPSGPSTPMVNPLGGATPGRSGIIHKLANRSRDELDKLGE